MKIFIYFTLGTFLITTCSGLNFNIFRWPTFKYYKVPDVFQKFEDIKQKTFSGFAALKRPIVKGLKSLKNQAFDFKNSLFDKNFASDEGSYEHVQDDLSEYLPLSLQIPNQENHGFLKVQLRPAAWNPRVHLDSYQPTKFARENNGAAQESDGTPHALPYVAGSNSPVLSTNGVRYQNLPSQTYDAQLNSLNTNGVSSSYSFHNQQGNLNKDFSPNFGLGHQNTFDSARLPNSAAAHNSYQDASLNVHSSKYESLGYRDINAPLSAAMAMGHILTEDQAAEVDDSKLVFNDVGKWRPLFRPSASVEKHTRLGASSQADGAMLIEHTNGTKKYVKLNRQEFEMMNNLEMNSSYQNREKEFLGAQHPHSGILLVSDDDFNSMKLMPETFSLSNLRSNASSRPQSFESTVSIDNYTQIVPLISTHLSLPLRDNIPLKFPESKNISTSLDESNFVNAEVALGKLIDETLLVNEKASRSAPTSPPKSFREPTQTFQTEDVPQEVVSPPVLLIANPIIIDTAEDFKPDGVQNYALGTELNGGNSPPSFTGRSTRQNRQPAAQEVRSKQFMELMEDLKLTVMMDLIMRSNLHAVLTTQGNFTIFAPVDSAFKTLSRRHLPGTVEALRSFLQFHIVTGMYGPSTFVDNLLLPTAFPRGGELRVNVYRHGADMGDTVTVNGARVMASHVLDNTAVVHVVQRVLHVGEGLMSITEQLATCDALTGAHIAVVGSGLSAVVGGKVPHTVFLPTTEAFAAIDNETVASFVKNITLLQELLLDHVVQGAHFSEGLLDGQYLPTLGPAGELQVRVSTDGRSKRLVGVGAHARVVQADIVASNGVIHLIDTVLSRHMPHPPCGLG